MIISQESTVETVKMNPTSIHIDADGTVVLRGVSTDWGSGGVFHEAMYSLDGMVSYRRKHID